MERVFSRKRTVLDRLCVPLERLIYRLTAVDPAVEMRGKRYATCFVFFGLTGTALLYGILRLQQFLPWFFPEIPHHGLNPGPCSEYGDQLFNHYHVAGLCWREHAELLQSDGGTLRAEFFGRGCGAGCECRFSYAVLLGKSPTLSAISGLI